MSILLTFVWGVFSTMYPSTAILDQSDQLMQDVAVQIEKTDSFATYTQQLQAIWALRYFTLITMGMTSPLDAAVYGKDTIEGELKQEMAKLKTYAVGHEKQHKVFVAELHKDLTSFVQKTVEFLVKTNQIEVAQVLTRGFTSGVGFHFI